MKSPAPIKPARQHVWDEARKREKFTVTDIRTASYAHRNLVVEYLMRWTAAGFLQAHEDKPQTFSWRRPAPELAPLVTRGGKLAEQSTGIERTARAARGLRVATPAEIAAIAEIAPQTARQYLRLFRKAGLIRRVNNPTRLRAAQLEWVWPHPVLVKLVAGGELVVSPLKGGCNDRQSR